MYWTKTQPTSPGFYWVRPVGSKAARIAEVTPCDALDHRPKGSLKLSFTQAEETRTLDGFEFAGPLPPPMEAADALGERAEAPCYDE